MDSFGDTILCKKSFLIELPLMIEHFFTSLGLKVEGLTCMEFVRNFRVSDSTPETKKNRKQSDTDDEFDEAEEPMEIVDEEMFPVCNFEEFLKQAIKEKRKIIIFEVEGKENYIGSHVFALFQAFHLFFESFNIFLSNRKFKPILLEPLYVFSKITGLQQHIQHYTLYLPELSELVIEIEEGTLLPNFDEATAFNAEPMVSFNTFLAQFKSRHLSDPPLIPESPHWPTRILFCAMVACGKINNVQQLKQCLGPLWQKRLNLSPAEEKALISIIISQRTDNDTKCSRCVKLFGLSLGDIHVLRPSLANTFTSLMTELAKRLEKDLSKKKLKSFPSEEEQKRWMQLQWPTDIRSNNVTQMLDSSRQILIPIRKSDDDTINREQYNTFLISTYSKQVSKSFGRAAIGYCTTRASKISSMQIPKIELNGRVPPNHVFHEFPNGEVTKPMNDWADFMAGTSFTLSLTDYDCEHISYAWLRNWQSTHRSTAVSAGSFWAYGLMGHFNTVNIHEIHQMLLKFKKPFEIISILLGAAVTYRGTANLLFFRAIATHVPAFIEPTLVELKFDPIVQLASIMGIGPLFQGSTHPSNTNRITNEMAKETFFEGENESNRYSYVLNCGIAIGLINLGRGVDIRKSELPAANSHYEIEERLIVLLEGGKRTECTDFGRQNSGLCRVQRIGTAALGSVALPPSANACTTIDFATLHGIGVNPEPNGMHAHNNEVNRYTANSVIGTLTKESSTTRELSNVNVHLTSPAAAIALALMYLKTGDKYILQKLTVPDTLPEIERIRPEVLMLRTLCALMVDYNNILSSSDYLENLIPEVIMRFVRDFEYTSAENEWWSDSVDMNTVAEAYYYIKTGICLSMGIRYASTYNREAAATIQSFLDEVTPLGKDYMIPKLRHYTKQTLTNSCAAIVVYSLSLVMAGSGDLETLRCIRQVRNHLTDPPSVESDSFIYGVQTFCNTALGFLFLGNARYGFSQSTEATAMLLISSYPIFSQSICDQKHYFQPLRFLWSIATEYRHLTPVDDSSYEAIRMQAKVTVAGENEKPLILQLPSVLPPLSSVKKIVFYARDYKEVELDMSNAEDKAELEKVLKEYFGRFPVKKVVKQYSKVFDSPPVFKLSDTFDCAPIRNDSFLLNLPLG
jgi:hypothetical protein